MNKSINKTAQAGFTLIELIVVIVILGILAATALPKFADLGSDARWANLQAGKASLDSVSNMIHGRYLVNPSAATTGYSMEGGVTIKTVHGYPASTDEAAGLALQKAAGFEEWQYVKPSTAEAADKTAPATGAGEVVFIPPSVKGTAAGLTCYVKFKEVATAGEKPTISMGATGKPADDCK